ncbi:uncharacterized protein [Gossypium hirsutum]|uniref:Uncharacterized protein n=1 Tax=Gossypium hirsutum TaxID=3635 RepID=A0ABM3BKP1_GOSHI|nr:uncharacterized protein LOC107893728 [Gossypium hirsutum]
MGKTLETLEPGQPICHHNLLHRCRHTSTPPSAKLLSPAFQRESMSRSVHRFGHKKPPKVRINKCSFTSPCLSYKCISNILDQIENILTKRLLQHNEASSGGTFTCNEAQTRCRVSQDHTK